VGTGLGAERGLLIRGGDILEQMQKLDTIVFDKTGTLTQGKPEATHYATIADKYNSATVLAWIAALEKYDLVRIFSKEDFRDDYIVTVNGAIRNQGEVPFAEGITLGDAISLSGGFADDVYLERGYIIRTEEDLSTKYIPFSPNNVFQQNGVDDKILLSKKDIIRVFSKKEFREDFIVEVCGSVRDPKNLVYAEGLTLFDVLMLSGGLKIEADRLRVEIARVNNIENATSFDDFITFSNVSSLYTTSNS